MLPKYSPTELVRIRVAFDHPEFVFDLKHDGFRALAYINGTCQLVSRRGNIYKSFAPLCHALSMLPCRTVLDGEIVCLVIEDEPEYIQRMCTYGDQDPLFDEPPSFPDPDQSYDEMLDDETWEKLERPPLKKGPTLVPAEPDQSEERAS